MKSLRLVALSLIVGILSTLSLQSIVTSAQEDGGEIITKQKTITQVFDEENQEGTIDLKKIEEEELQRPEECNQDMIVCEIQEVSYEITLKKTWVKYNAREMSDYEFANRVKKLSSSLDEQPKAETATMQEVLARRGLLRYLNGEIVQERGFFGALTWLGLIKLAQIKDLSPNDPDFENKLRDEVNNLLDRMANDDGYVANHALPREEEMTPQQGDDLYDLWREYLYLAQLAENAKRVSTGATPINAGIDVNIDGYVNVERVQD